MNDYEKELMANGTYLIRMRECEVQPTPFIQMPPKRPISPYAKFDKYHKKKKRK